MENGQLCLDDKTAVVWLSTEPPSNPSIAEYLLVGFG